jgi:hypothetical protein
LSCRNRERNANIDEGFRTKECREISQEMPKLELLIPIVNVDSSILRLRLEPGYTIEAMSAAEFTDLINQLDSEFPFSGYLSRSARLPFVNQVEKKVYMIKWSTTVNAAELKGVIAPASHLEKKFGIINRVSRIQNILKLLTICKEGTVLAPDHYEMLIDEAGETRCLSAQTSGSSIPSDMKFVIDSDEEESINKFVRETEFLLFHDYTRAQGNCGFENEPSHIGYSQIGV